MDRYRCRVGADSTTAIVVEFDSRDELGGKCTRIASVAAYNFDGRQHPSQERRSGGCTRKRPDPALQ